jgi:hypothetical protein
MNLRGHVSSLDALLTAIKGITLGKLLVEKEKASRVLAF